VGRYECPAICADAAVVVEWRGLEGEMLGEMLGEVGEGVCRLYTLRWFWLFCLLCLELSFHQAVSAGVWGSKSSASSFL